MGYYFFLIALEVDAVGGFDGGIKLTVGFDEVGK